MVAVCKRLPHFLSSLVRFIRVSRLDAHCPVFGFDLTLTGFGKMVGGGDPWWLVPRNHGLSDCNTFRVGEGLMIANRSGLRGGRYARAKSGRWVPVWQTCRKSHFHLLHAAPHSDPVIPKGLNHSAQGREERATPGGAPKHPPYSEGVGSGSAGFSGRRLVGMGVRLSNQV
jgi:hypothetical protein